MTSPHDVHQTLDSALFTLAHTELLARSAVSPEHAFAHGVRSAVSSADLPPDTPAYWASLLPGLLFPWRDDAGRVEWQLRPDQPRSWEAGGDPVKYLFRGADQGYQSTQWSLRRPGPTGAVLFVEGTKQALAAAEHAPDGMGVVGLAGCWGHSDRGLPAQGLSVASGREAVVCLDADYASNPKVWDAGLRLKRALELEGATSVRFVRLAASGTTGLDDVLGARAAADRTLYLRRLTDAAEPEAFAKSNRPKARVVAGGTDLFDPLDGFKTRTAASALLSQSPMALTREHQIAIFDGRVYRTGPQNTAFAGAVAAMVGERYRAAHTSAVRDMLYAELGDVVIPERGSTPLVAVANGLLDVTTGLLHPFTPEHLSTTLLPVRWPESDAEAACPFYEAWLPAMVGADQVDGLEELAGQMLDPRVTPPRALFLFGPSRSGKSTFLRLLQAVAGQDNTSAVTLHQLADDRFAAADVYGKILNTAGDLSAADVRDISLFKSLTGDDLVQANRKHGARFGFRNKALFAFSANKLPVVSESSRAYHERMRPVHFPTSFAGAENPAVEQAMMGELPGILRRWASAAQRRRDRGSDVSVPDRVRRQFEQGTNSVVDWVARCAEVRHLETPRNATPGQTTTALLQAYQVWMSTGGKKALGRDNFAAALRNMAPDVQEYRDVTKRRMWNITVRPSSEWDE